MTSPAPFRFVLFALVLLFASPALAQGPGGMGGLGTRAPAPAKVDPMKVDAKKEKAIRKLLAVTNSAEMTDALMEQMLLAIPGSDEFWAEWKKEFAAAFEDAMVLIYGKHFDMEEIQAMTRFYESDVGKRIVAKTKIVTMESTLIGQQLGMQMAQRILQKRQKKEEAAD